jgi:hypothetical protein
MKVADANFEQLLDHYRTGCNFSLAKYLRGVLASMFLLASLDMQASLFELIMKENAQSMLQKLITTNLVIQMWMSIDGKSFLWHSLSKYVKVAKLGIFMVLGRVQDERTLSTITIMKTKVRNCLTTNLPLVIGIKAPSFFDINTFSYDVVYKSWRDACERHCDIE